MGIIVRLSVCLYVTYTRLPPFTLVNFAAKMVHKCLKNSSKLFTVKFRCYAFVYLAQ